MAYQYRWVLLFAISLMAFVINVDYTAVNLALIPMAQDFNADLNTLQWTLSAYVIAWAMWIIPAGKLVDKYKKKNICIFGLVIFLIASLIAGSAQSAHVIILARILQGIGGAIYMPTMYALIHINFEEQERGKAIGLMSLGVGLGMALGPFLGGLLLTSLNWRSIFFINIPIVLLAGLIIFFNKDKEQLANKAMNIDILSAILLSLCIVAPLYLLSESQNQVVIKSSLLISVAVIALIAYILRQKRSVEPLIPARLLINLPFIACCIGMLLEQYSFSAIIVSIGLYLQKIVQLSSLQSSVGYLPLTIIFGVIAVIGGKWVDKIGISKPITLGLVLMLIGSIVFAQLLTMNMLWVISLSFAVLGIGMGLAFAGLNSGIIKVVSQEDVGIASSVFSMCALIGNSLGVTITILCYESASLLNLTHTLHQMGQSLNQNQVQQLIQYIANIGNAHQTLNHFSLALQTLIHEQTQTALSHGISNAMLVNAAVCFIAIITCTFLLNRYTAAKDPASLSKKILAS